MSAGTQDVTMEVAASFRLSFTWEDVNGDAYDLSGKTAKMQVRPKAGATGTPLIEVTDTEDPDTHSVITLTDGEQESEEDPTPNVIVYISATDMEALSGLKKAAYDLYVISSPTDRTRVLEGKVTVSPTTTIFDEESF